MNIEIKKLMPDLAEDYVRFFDQTPHNKEYGHKCYCVTWRSDDSYSEDCGHWFQAQEERRAKAFEFVTNGNIQGYLAYCEGRVVGWCNAIDRSRVRLAVATYAERWGWPIEQYREDEKAKAIFCFMIAPEMQRRGVATKLLEYLCADAANEGFDCVEAYTSVDFAHDGYQGPVTLYEKCGFVRHANSVGNAVMRKTLRRRFAPFIED
jgi:GNAT superfamily N-acetyltransferase